MPKTKLRKQGSSIVVTIPASETKNLEVEKEYYVKTDEHGNINLIPVLDDPYENAKHLEFYEENLWQEMKPVGREIW